VGADLHVELVQTKVVDLDRAGVNDMEAAYRELATHARAELDHERIVDDSLDTERADAFAVTRFADVRYRGQAYHLTLPVRDPIDIGELARDFRRRFA